MTTLQYSQWQLHTAALGLVVFHSIHALLFDGSRVKGEPCRPAGRAADVKRCYSSRGALALLDFDDPSIEGVQALMVRAAMLPAFLRCANGRKFIAHLFTLHVSLPQ